MQQGVSGYSFQIKLKEKMRNPLKPFMLNSARLQV